MARVWVLAPAGIAGEILRPNNINIVFLFVLDLYLVITKSTDEIHVRSLTMMARVWALAPAGIAGEILRPNNKIFHNYCPCMGIRTNRVCWRNSQT